MSNDAIPSTATIDTAYSASKREMRRILFSSFVGTAVEYYDFILYATAAGIVFNRVFFAGLDPTQALMISFGTLAAGYIARPIGGFLFGHLGDKLGRKKILMATVLMMGICSTLIGLLPATSQIGLWAPILLVMLRIVQGIAVGGEWGGATLIAFENAKKHSRGFASAFAYMGAPAGTLVGTLILAGMALLPDEEFLAWGWRVPFVFSAVLMLIAVFIRKRVNESRIFQEASAAAEKRPVAPIKDVFRHHPLALLRAFAAGLSGQTTQGLMGAWAIAYAVQQAATSPSGALTIKSIAALTTIGTIILAAHLSDRFGRRRILVIGNVFAIVLALPIMLLLQVESGWTFFIALFLGLTIVQSFTSGPYGAFAGEQFPTPVRYTGTSIAYQVASTVGAGFAPLIATALVAAAGGSLWLVAILWISAGTVSLISVATGKDRTKLDIRELDGRGAEPLAAPARRVARVG